LKKKIPSQLLLVLPLSLLFLIALGIHFYAGHQSKLARASERESQIVKIEPQLGVAEIAQALKQRGIIRSSRLFLLAAFLKGSATELKAGEYAFTPGMSLLEIIRKLERGDIFHYAVTIPEGYTLRDIAQHLNSLGLADPERFLRLCHDQGIISRYGIKAHSLEGYLFPDTYYLMKGLKEEEIIERMVHRFLQVFSPEQEQRAKGLAMSRHQVVTLASLIEAETPQGEERYLVSSVFHRRLKLKMPLQCDPTVIYAVAQEYGKKSRLSRRHLNFPSPYNTYLHPGLPPGPICNPGAASLEAALAPASSSYLYFVSKGNGTHHFSSTWTEHSRAVRQYQSRRPGS
jgi:UPF0755 protein